MLDVGAILDWDVKFGREELDDHLMTRNDIGRDGLGSEGREVGTYMVGANGVGYAVLACALAKEVCS